MFLGQKVVRPVTLQSDLASGVSDRAAGERLDPSSDVAAMTHVLDPRYSASMSRQVCTDGAPWLPTASIKIQPWRTAGLGLSFR